MDQCTNGDLRTPSRGKVPIHENRVLLYILLPSDPDELVDQLKLLYFEKVGGNDNPILREQIVAIVDKLLENECITTNQQQNIASSFSLFVLQRISLWVKDFILWVRCITNPIFFVPFLSSNLFLSK